MAKRSFDAEIVAGGGGGAAVEIPFDVEAPPILAQALASEPKARATFDSLAYTYRKEIARSIGTAKREETRQRRLATAISALAAGRRP